MTITDAGGLTATSSVSVTVNQTLTAIAVSPPAASLNAGGTQQFTATGKDQFGVALAAQPTFTWGTTAGTISAGGLLTAPTTSVSSGTVTASSGTVNGTATFAVGNAAPTVATAAAATPFSGDGHDDGPFGVGGGRRRRAEPDLHVGHHGESAGRR